MRLDDTFAVIISGLSTPTKCSPLLLHAYQDDALRILAKVHTMTVPAHSRQSLWKRIRKGDGEEIQSPTATTTTVSRRSVAAEDWLSTYWYTHFLRSDITKH